ncbi:low molecular weight phosphatase family protein [Kitasatospora cineracea]|uniref:arsenate-mycothiol transferase ArsC n=1 Tax=Kitasatospora cineracea TaxID=88074 RepID=UPI00381A5093
MSDPARGGAPTPVLRGTGAVLQRIGAQLTRRYTGTFDAATVAGHVEDSFRLLSERGVSIARHLPLLASRFAAERLDALARQQGRWPRERPQVLFVCAENSGRSQLAAALLEAVGGASVRVLSAGSSPGCDIDPVALRLLEEVGLDVAGAFPKPLTPEVVATSDVVVTLGCGDACPVVPGRRYLSWDMPDLKGLDIESARSVREGLRARVTALLRELEDGSPRE